MDVAGEDHGVADAVPDHPADDPVARGGVPVPRVHRHHGRGGVGVVVPSAEEDLLAEQVPRRGRVAEAVEQPLLLLPAGQAAAGCGRVGAVLVAVAACLVVAVLPGVEHVEGREAAPGDASVELEVGTARDGGPPQRHVLVVGPVRRRPSRREPSLLRRLLADLVGVVVVDLVVVPDGQPRRRRVGCLQVGVGAVLRVPPTVVGQRDRLATHVGTVEAVAGALVLVVAEVEDQVGPLVGEVAVGVEPAGLPVRAGHEGHRHRRDCGAVRR